MLAIFFFVAFILMSLFVVWEHWNSAVLRSRLSLTELACRVSGIKFQEGLDYKGLVIKIEEKIKKGDQGIKMVRKNSLDCLISYFEEMSGMPFSWFFVREIMEIESIARRIIFQWEEIDR